MKIRIIITAILFLYGAFSTLFHDTALAGNIGKIVGETNIHLFGYLAYINIFILFYPLYKLYTDARVRKDLDFYLGWILLFIALVIFEALVLDLKDAGYMGTQIVEFLQPFIGKAGLWLLWLMIVTLSLVFVLDDDFSFSGLKIKIPKPSVSFGWIGTTMVTVSKVLKKVFTNPFASPSLEDEMMPILEEKPKPKRKTPVKRKPTVKKVVKKTEAVSSSPTIDEIAEDAVVNEILELEHDMECVATPKNSATSNSNVQIVSELEENSKLMEQIDKGTVAKPKNFKLPKLDFLQKAPKVTKKVNEAEIDRKIEDYSLSYNSLG